jgi:hypothetical protein
MNTTLLKSRLTEDAAFVRQASVHRDARLARCFFRSAGPNPKLPGDTLYLFHGRPDADGMALALAISAPDELVTARDAVGLRRTFLARDAAYDAGGPWWIKPLGVPLADRAPASVADVAPAPLTISRPRGQSRVNTDAPLVPAIKSPERRKPRPSLLRDLRARVGAKLELWDSPDNEGRVYRAAGDVALHLELTPAQRAAQRVDLDARRARLGLPPRPASTLTDH